MDYFYILLNSIALYLAFCTTLLLTVAGLYWSTDFQKTCGLPMRIMHSLVVGVIFGTLLNIVVSAFTGAHKSPSEFTIFAISGFLLFLSSKFITKVLSELSKVKRET